MPTEVRDNQVRKFRFGIRNTHPVGIGEEVWDEYFNDGTGVLPMGVWVYEPPGVWVLQGGGGGIQSTDVNSSGVPTFGPIDLIQGANMTLSRPAPGQIQFDALALSVVYNNLLTADKYHDLYPIPNPINGVVCGNGVSSQRTLTYVRNDAVTPERDFICSLHYIDYDGYLLLELVIEKHANFNSSPPQSQVGQRDIYAINFFLSDWNDAPIDPTNDMCLVWDDNTQLLHIIFVGSADQGLTYNVWDGVIDPYVIDRPDPATLVNYSLQCSRVNTVPAILGYPCKHVSASWQSNYNDGRSVFETVVVAWIQNLDGTDTVHVNHYDPLLVYPNEYTDVPEVEISDPIHNSDFPTVEVNNFILGPLSHVAWVTTSGEGTAVLCYGVEDLNGNWGTTPVANPVPSFGSGSPLTDSVYDSPPTMVVLDNNEEGRVEVFICIACNDSTPPNIPPYIFSFRFTPDIVNGGPPTFYEEGIVNWYNDQLFEEHPKKQYQLGASQFEINFASHNYTYLYLYRMLWDFSSGDYDDAQFEHLLLATHAINHDYWSNSSDYMYWHNTVIENNLIDTGFGTGATFMPKVHFGRNLSSVYEMKRKLESWFPINIYARAKTYYSVGLAIVISPTIRMKDQMPFMFINDE